MGRGLTAKQRSELGFTQNKTPCHPTLTETMHLIDPDELIDLLGRLVVKGNDNNERQIAIDGKTMRATKNEKGNAAHVLSAFCAGLQNIVGNQASHGKGMEISDALKLLDRLDLTDKVVTGDAIFCQKYITEKIVAKGGDYLFPVKKNQKALFENIETAFKQPVFPPRSS